MANFLKIIGAFMLGVACCVIFPAAVRAADNFSVVISDPDRPAGETVFKSSIVYSSLSVPSIKGGDNQVLGTLRITDTKVNNTQVQVGNKVRVTLPIGSCYMQTPDAENYQNYVKWPAEVNGAKNKICDETNQPGIKFVSATPRSITVAVNHMDQKAGVMVIDFVFDQKDLSAIRFSPLFKSAAAYAGNPDQPITRIDFFQLVSDVTFRIPSCPVQWQDTDKSLEDSFTDFFDLKNTPAAQVNKIELLASANLIKGYPDGRLRPNQTITRAEAANMVGSIFPRQECPIVFRDNLPAWADGLKTAIARGLMIGYPDGSFHPDQPLTRSEALTLLQNTLESYSQS